MESIVEVRRRGEVDDQIWSRFIRCLAWQLEVGPREGDPPEDWSGPDPTAAVVEFTVPGEFSAARAMVIDTATICLNDPLGVAIIGP